MLASLRRLPELWKTFRELTYSRNLSGPNLPSFAMKAVIFDVDGTLVDSLGDIADACNYSLTKLGHDNFSYDEYRLLAGGGNNKLMAKVLKIRMDAEPEPELLKEAVSLKMLYENGPNGRQRTKAFPGAREMLRTLHSNGIQLAVLSNKNEPNVRQIISEVFPDVPWRYVAGARNDTPLKPDPTAALRIVKNYLPGVLPADCTFVGDTDYDMKTAIAAGMTPVGVSWGNRSSQDLHYSGAITVAGKAEDIADFVLNKMQEDTESTKFVKHAIKVM